MSQIDIPSSMNFNDWSTRLTTLETKAPTAEMTAADIAPLLPQDESQIATLELATEDDVAVTDEPATCEALEQFRARYREMREHSIFKKKTNQ